MPSRDAQLCPAAELISGVPNSDVLLPQFVALSATHHAAKLIIGSARFMGLMGCLVGDGYIYINENSSEKKASTTSGTFRLQTANRNHCALVHGLVCRMALCAAFRQSLSMFAVDPTLKHGMLSSNVT